MTKTIYKVYCGSNGKFYTYLSLVKAESLFTRLMLQNYKTSIDEIKNGQTKRLKEYGRG